MKLVELLARELGEWPSKADWVVSVRGGDEYFCSFGYGFKPVQDERDRVNHTWTILGNGGYAQWGFGDNTLLPSEPSDRLTAIVTRADWEAERAKLAKPAEQEGKWIRHRGGKCPVDGVTKVDVKFREGTIKSGKTADCWAWHHTKDSDDIMAYRMHKPEQHTSKVDELTIEVTANTEGVREVIEDMQMQIDQIDGPIKWRDRITEIDATTSALATERAELVQKLASEGFALIGRPEEVVQPVEDMSDWRNWRVGDQVEITGETEGHEFETGDIVTIEGVTGSDECRFKCADRYEWWWVSETECKFHSRP